MKTLVWIGVASLTTMGFEAAAFSGAGSATSNYQSKDNTAGLCTSDNEDEPYYKQGLCQSLAEQISKGCTKDKVDEICKRLQHGRDSNGKPLKIILDPPGAIGCQNKDKTKGFSDLVKNPSQCAFFMLNMMAMTVVRESNWDVLKDEDNGGKGPGGLLNLNLDGSKNTDMENGEYACGCKDKVVTTSGQSDVSFAGQSPGPLDGHHSVICGTTMALFKIAADGSFTGGNKKDKATDEQGKPKEPRLGMSKLFASHEDRPRDEPPRREESPESKNAKWYAEKTKALCKYMFSNTNTWQRQLTNDIGGEAFSNKPADTQQ